MVLNKSPNAFNALLAVLAIVLGVSILAKKRYTLFLLPTLAALQLPVLYASGDRLGNGLLLMLFGMGLWSVFFVYYYRRRHLFTW